jgi:hypothetical protein
MCEGKAGGGIEGSEERLGSAGGGNDGAEVRTSRPSSFTTALLIISLHSTPFSTGDGFVVPLVLVCSMTFSMSVLVCSIAFSMSTNTDAMEDPMTVIKSCVSNRLLSRFDLSELNFSCTNI